MNIKRTVIIIFCFIFLGLLTSIESMASISVIGGLCREIKIGSSRTADTNQGVIIVKNNGEEAQEVKVYQTDYQFYSDGKKLYDEPGKLARSNASWISFTPKQFTVPPKGTSNVNYSIKIPNSEKLSGTYWSMLMIEVISNTPSQETKPEDGKLMTLGIKTAVRYGVQIVTNFGDTGSHNLKFLATKLVKDSKKKIFQVDIENTGERWLKPSLWIELYNKEGSYIGKFDGGNMRLYPGTSGRFSADLSEVPEGTYKALTVADCGGNDIFGATYDLDYKDAGSSKQ
jgi:hypothetical protein